MMKKDDDKQFKALMSDTIGCGLKDFVKMHTQGIYKLERNDSDGDDPSKVYVVEAERTDELDDSYICGVYSRIDKAVDKVRSVKGDPDYEFYISVFDLDDYNYNTD